MRLIISEITFATARVEWFGGPAFGENFLIQYEGT